MNRELEKLTYSATCVSTAGALGQTVCGRSTRYAMAGNPICADCRRQVGAKPAMPKREAAAIIADNIGEWVLEHDLDDREITETMVEEAISRCARWSDEGSAGWRAARANPAVRTVRTAYRRASGLID